MDPISQMGLPNDYLGNPIPQGLEGAQAAFQPAPPLSSSQGWWDIIKNDTLGGIQWGEEKITDAVSGTYQVAKNAVGTVVSDVTTPIANAAKSTYTYLILTVVVVGAVIYFAGKSGAISVKV